MNPIDNIKRAFNDQLDRHGYGFQYSVLKRAEELSIKRASPWVLEACEYPVEVHGDGTRIDFILRPSQGQPYLLLAECKRADPKFNHWCFIRAPVVRPTRDCERFVADRIRCAPSGTAGGLTDPHVGPHDLRRDITMMADHIGRTVREPTTKGEGGASEHDAIEKAASQVCRGVNGLIETMQKRRALFRSANPTPQGFYERTLIPVIFTTARLYECDYDLSQADAHTGKCDLSRAKLYSQDWLYFQYHLSPGIKHSVVPEEEQTTIAALLDYEYVRTIPIVSAEGIGSFLSDFKPWEWE